MQHGNNIQDILLKRFEVINIKKTTKEGGKLSMYVFKK